MKRLSKLILLLCFIFSIHQGTNLNASCSSEDGIPDNGHCDKSDINNKVCGAGSPLDCAVPVSIINRVKPRR